jgi:LysM repeat protein
MERGIHIAQAPRSRWIARLLAAAALAALVAAVALVVTHSVNLGSQAGSGGSGHAAVHHLPPYWMVRPGDTMALIAAKTGLTIDQLEAFNPNADPLSLTPGERLNLWQHPPVPHVRPKPLGPLYWTVKPGQSFGSIAAATGIDITTLEELNPNLKPASLQPGNRVRLRH